MWSAFASWIWFTAGYYITGSVVTVTKPLSWVKCSYSLQQAGRCEGTSVPLSARHRSREASHPRMWDITRDLRARTCSVYVACEAHKKHVTPKAQAARNIKILKPSAERGPEGEIFHHRLRQAKKGSETRLRCRPGTKERLAEKSETHLSELMRFKQSNTQVKNKHPSRSLSKRGVKKTLFFRKLSPRRH